MEKGAAGSALSLLHFYKYCRFSSSSFSSSSASNALHSRRRAALRLSLIHISLAGAFEPWHFACNDEGDSNLCYLRIVPESGFFHKDGTGYRVDFINGTAAEFPFTAQVEMALQPRANIPVF